MGTITISSEEAGKTCPYCRFPLKVGGQAQRCDACGAVHHEECWEEGRGCAVLGCRMAGAGGAPTAVAPAAAYAADAAPAASTDAPGAIPGRSGGSRNLAIGVVSVLVIAAAGVGAFVALRHGSSNSATPPVTTVQTVQTVQVTTQPPSTKPSTTPRSPTAGAEEQATRKLEAIVRFSERGRLAVRSGQYDAAIANRQETLARLVRLTGGSARLQRAKQTFARAINISLQSDEAYASGGNASQFDAEATRLKRLFVTRFNPIARRYGLGTFDANGI